MEMTEGRCYGATDHLGSMVLVLWTTNPYQYVDAFIAILCGTTHTSLKQLLLTQGDENWPQ